MRRAVNETSRVRNSYYTLGIQRGRIIIIKGRRDRSASGEISWLSMRYGNLCFLLVNVYPYQTARISDRGRGMIIYGQRGSTIGIVGREVTRDGGHGSVPVLVSYRYRYRHRALDKAMIQRTSTSTCVMYDNIIMISSCWTSAAQCGGLREWRLLDREGAERGAERGSKQSNSCPRRWWR